MKKYIVLMCVLTVVLTACGDKKTETPESQMAISDPARPVEATVGNEFTIAIEGNPSTGYHWELVGELDAALLKLVRREYRYDEPAMPGSGGVELWVIQALAAGETSVTLGYYPPSNDPVEPARTATFTIVIK
jgi:inhibitor of cysteine peptidase